MKNDVRTRFTKKVIKDAFLSLLQENSLSNITVKEICKRAEINRSTFYKYYQDCYDLMDQLEDAYLQEAEELIHGIQTQGLKPILITMLQSLRQKEDLFQVLSREENYTRFSQKIIRLSFPLLQQNLSQQSKNKEQLNMEFIFLSGGAGALISEWMRNGMVQPPEQIADAINTLCHNAVQLEDR